MQILDGKYSVALLLCGCSADRKLYEGKDLIFAHICLILDCTLDIQIILYIYIYDYIYDYILYNMLYIIFKSKYCIRQVSRHAAPQP